jgi:hypothetical protein
MLTQKRLVFASILLTSFFHFASSELNAQVVIRNSRTVNLVARGYPRWWYRYYSPVDAIAQRIRAEAHFVRAVSHTQIDYANARKIRAQAFRQEIVNSVAYVRAYWDRKAIGEAERMKRYVAPLERQKIINSQTWARLQDHPELNGAAIVRGNAMNFLLDRLSSSVLAYNFLENPDNVPPQLNLDDQLLHRLQLRQDLPNGERLVFRANEGTALQVDWWPYALRDRLFEDQRNQFERARVRVVMEAINGQISNEALRGLMKALDELDAAFRGKYIERYRLSSTAKFRHFLTTKRFIRSLAGEISRLQTTGDASAFDGSLRFQGGNLVALLTFMSRNGLDFAPAKPGEEAAYHTTFVMMRDLYLTVADE